MNLEWRTATQVGVSWPKRRIDLIVMPYESEATVEHQGRMITEICSRGAYDGIERRPNRVVAVNRDHQVERTVGKAVTFHPNHEDGLFAELRISATALGDETLALAEDEVLSSSAGFAPLDEKWEGRDRRRLVKCWLGHIAMTPDPAYTDARVLAVRARSEPPATPNLDRVRAWLLEDRYDQI
jgi:HK97 family phage prohead protease